MEQTNLLESLTGDIWDDMDNLYYFISIGLMVWALAFFIGLTIIKKRGKYLIVFAPLVILWLTIMAATPVHCEFRYMLAVPLTLPFIVFSSLLPNNTNHR